VSKRTEAKKARRKKRRAVRDVRWLPGAMLDQLAETTDLEIADELDRFDQRLTERGWTFDEEFSEEGFASWVYAPSGAEVDEPDHEGVTRICASAGDTSDREDGCPPFPDGVSVFLVGDCEIHTFAADEVFEHITVIEAHRYRDPCPVFA
jgi:hypothetical protein